MSENEDRYEARWLVAHYAAKQPRGNSLWQQIVDELIKETYIYLEIRDAMKEKA